MKEILKKPDLSRYNIADHLAFHDGALVICIKHQTVINAPPMIATYTDTVTQEATIYKWMRRSELTKKKKETDRERDKTLSSMGGIVRAHLQNFDTAIRDAANHVHNLLKNYGDVVHLSYDAETIAFDSILAHLDSSDYLSAVELLGIQAWVNKLKELNNLFKTFVDDTAEEQLQKPNIPPRASRHATDEALRPITGRVEALANINGQQPFVAFAEEFNVLVKHYNTLMHEHYGRLHVRTDIAPAIVDIIPPQSVTGQPVFVIPTVSLRRTLNESEEEIVKLIFSEDFNVAYRNNLNPGTATLIITGIGKYKGEIVTTFNIQ